MVSRTEQSNSLRLGGQEFAVERLSSYCVVEYDVDMIHILTACEYSLRTIQELAVYEMRQIMKNRLTSLQDYMFRGRDMPVLLCTTGFITQRYTCAPKIADSKSNRQESWSVIQELQG
jgi:hypothetical protein